MKGGNQAGKDNLPPPGGEGRESKEAEPFWAGGYGKIKNWYNGGGGKQGLNNP